MAIFAERVRKLTRPPEEARVENLKKWVSQLPDVTPIEQLEARCPCRAAGIIQNIRIDPREGRDSVEVTIVDGTGTLVARWLGRSSLSGMRLGTGLIVEGIVGIGGDGERQVLNPEYHLTPGPEHG